jgi:opacity protein-like surface antigen
MKNLLATIGLSTILLIASSAQADVSEEDYNSHTNNHVGYAEAHSGKTMEAPKASMKMKRTSDEMTNDSPFYNASEDPFSLEYSHE